MSAGKPSRLVVPASCADWQGVYLLPRPFQSTRSKVCYRELHTDETKRHATFSVQAVTELGCMMTDTG